ncbi:MAG: hypothetical protein Q9187_006610 [Circinaria calcarea]
MAKSLSFLDLPQNVRARVFHFTDLTRECPIDLTFEKVRLRLLRVQSDVEPPPRICQFHAWKIRGTSTKYKYKAECYCPKLPVRLLRVSHLIYAEVIPILYGRNVFVTWHTPGSGYSSLISLSSYAWKSMASLHIKLCAFDEDCPSRQIVLEKWVALCAYMARRITPFQLDFSMDCIGSTITVPEIARQVMQPIKRLPELKNCAVCLTLKRDEQLHNIAKHMSLQASGRHTALHAVFPRFDRLPREIRLMILVETELVLRSDECEDAGGISIAKQKSESRNLCCKRCTPDLMACCCQTRRAAYSTTCVCRRIPTPLFYVSRQMSYEATEVFYSHNTFLLRGSIESMTKFLHRLSPFALWQLRTVDIRLEYDQFKEWPDAEMAHTHDWQSLISFMNENLNISNLALSLDLESCVEDHLTQEDDIVDDVDDNDGDELKLEWLRDICTDIAIPLGQLQEIRSFQVVLGHLDHYESVLEEMVLGSRPDREGSIGSALHGIPEIR